MSTSIGWFAWTFKLQLFLASAQNEPMTWSVPLSVYGQASDMDAPLLRTCRASSLLENVDK